MENTLNVKQFKSRNQAEYRLRKLRAWMYENGLTWSILGEQMGGITGSGALTMLKGERMPVHRHEALIRFGVPARLLPEPRDVNPGRKPGNYNK